MLCFPPGNESYGRQIRHKTVIKMFAEAQTEAVRVVGQAIGSSDGLIAANSGGCTLRLNPPYHLSKSSLTLRFLRFLIAQGFGSRASDPGGSGEAGHASTAAEGSAILIGQFCGSYACLFHISAASMSGWLRYPIFY